ncbi:MAG: dihydroorotate dehydrogenase electron transfer subunit [Anaerolineae bacterium]|jgi:dihydroorotate dehydrogenase electron transfer subunit
MTLPQITRIKDVWDETRTIRTFVLDAAVGDAQPGQFVMLWLPGVDEKPFAIACPDPLTVTVARVGPFSTTLHRREVGDQVGWRGPYGNGFTLWEDHPALLVAGGYGAAPLYFLATMAVERGVPTEVAIGARTALDLPFVERFEVLGVDLLVATDDGSAGQRVRVTELVAEGLARRPRPAVYACGPELMLVALHELCTDFKAAGQFNLERYMKCGFGVCGQCALDDLLVCQDGPVFTVEQLGGLRDFGRVRRSATGRALPVR